MHIAVQIVNYRTKKELTQCVSTLKKDINGLNNVNIYVLDNNSGDNLDSLQNEYPEIILLQSHINRGFGGGHNEIAKHHNADIIILLNPDCEIIEQNTIERLVVGLIGNAHIGVIGPRLITMNNKTQWRDHGSKFAYGNELLIKLGVSVWKKCVVPTEVNRVSGACFAMKRELFEKVGGFDERYFMYKEEEDLCYNIRRLGKHIIYDPRITVKHIGGVTQAKRHLIPSNLYFIRKHLLHWK